MRLLILALRSGKWKDRQIRILMTKVIAQEEGMDGRLKRAVIRQSIHLHHQNIRLQNIRRLQKKRHHQAKAKNLRIKKGNNH